MKESGISILEFCCDRFDIGCLEGAYPQVELVLSVLVRNRTRYHSYEYLKNPVNSRINYQPQLVQEFLNHQH